MTSQDESLGYGYLEDEMLQSAVNILLSGIPSDTSY